MLIGITGYAGSGKDTVATMLWQQLRSGFVAQDKAQLMSFAAPIRQMLLALGVPWDYMTDRQLKEQPVPGLGKSYRQLGQTLGTEWGRVATGDPDFWVRVAERQVSRLDSGTLVLFTDVRFPNEADFIHAYSGLLIHVDRPGIQPVRDHESERHVPALAQRADITIRNTGTLDELHAQVRRIALDIAGGRTQTAKEAQP